MNLIKSEQFGAISCDLYQDSKGEYFITRKQIGEALEYANPQKAIDKIHSRNKTRLDAFSATVILTATDGKTYKTNLYSAKGVYEICRFSHQPKANEFYDWVYDLLENLRTGKAQISFTMPQTKIELIEAWLASEKKNVVLEQEKLALEQTNLVLLPKAKSFDTFMNAEGNQSMKKVAKSLGIGRNKLFEFLREEKILMSDNTPYQEYMDRDYFVVEQRPCGPEDKQFFKAVTYVSNKGIIFIERLLKKKGMIA